MRQNVEKSLKRLGVERIDLFQLHCWVNDGTSALDWLETLNDLRSEGKIDHIGVSIRDYRPDEGIELARYGLVDSIQVVFNLFEQRPSGALFENGADSNTAFIARVPLDSGSLIGNWTKDSYQNFPIGSQQHSMFRGERFLETFQRIEALKQICVPYFPTLAEAAMRYVLQSAQVSTVIPGMKNKGEVDMNIKYSDKKTFPIELLHLLPEHEWIRNYYK